ncbi:hypothetical protein NBM50_08510, partial [Xylophilus ampelinus]|nr:hypothetical protein [Xylophilus ampelinus]
MRIYIKQMVNRRPRHTRRHPARPRSRDAERSGQARLDTASAGFARHDLSDARVDRIAGQAGRPGLSLRRAPRPADDGRGSFLALRLMGAEAGCRPRG